MEGATDVNDSGSRSSKTFKPKKNIPEGSHQYELLKHAEATLGSGNLRMAVMLPEGEDLNEWVAVNTVDFFNQINMLYGTITDFCTEESCPVMSAGPKYEYHWADGTNIKKPIKCSAPKYIDYLMTWVQDQLDDETLFPSKIGVPFPKNFMSVAKTILKRLFRVYAHIYHQHFDPVIQLQEEAHLNTSFKHFIFFVQVSWMRRPLVLRVSIYLHNSKVNTASALSGWNLPYLSSLHPLLHFSMMIRTGFWFLNFFSLQVDGMQV
ncbi:MOB kinase activator 1B isoform X1 [Papio anubis]|uniref:Deoxycytidine kinase n=1 Tax=Papio anubis TaxID=9555 RepID=A0A2I3N2M0_PAPAN|nr:MOB kinase activator 1B isoform X1 [Papio anubis]XP_021794241.1 MOB kinase activator 1B isoform X1 [Papio anubis]